VLEGIVILDFLFCWFYLISCCERWLLQLEPRVIILEHGENYLSIRQSHPKVFFRLSGGPGIPRIMIHV
jgi:hypothetical protein